jgi:hypothetical protein
VRRQDAGGRRRGGRKGSHSSPIAVTGYMIGVQNINFLHKNRRRELRD